MRANHHASKIQGSNSEAYSDIRGLDVMAWLCHAVEHRMRLRRMGCEDSVLDGVSPALRAWASDFGKTQSHQRSSPPLIRPTDVGFLRLTLFSNGTRRWAVHGPVPLARLPASRPGQEGSPQRIRGGSTPCQPSMPVSQRRSSPSPLGRGLG